jgi:hypothetical protein
VLDMSERRTAATASGSSGDWATPRSSENEQRTRKHQPSVQDGHGKMLAAQVLEWPTPDTVLRKSRKAMTASENNGRRSGGGNSSPPGLAQTVEIAEGRMPPEMEGLNLPPATRAMLEWPTPKAVDGRPKGNAGTRKSPSLSAMDWPTATQRDWKDGACRDANVPTNGLLGRAVPRTTGSRHARLNPAWVEVLMGYPVGWVAPGGGTP